MNQVFNCGTDRYISYKGLCTLIHDELKNGEDVRKYLFYDPNEFDHWKGSGAAQFPFRRDTFITTPSKAKQLLGWSPKHSIDKDIAEEVKEYVSGEYMKEEWGREVLKQDLEVIASKDHNMKFTYPFLDLEKVLAQ